MERKKTLIGHLLVLSTIVIYAFNTNFMKVLLVDWINPYGFVLLRCGAIAIGFTIAYFLFARSSRLPKGQDLIYILLAGLLGICGNLFFYLVGLSKTSPVDAFVIRTIQPILMMVFSMIIFKEKFTLYSYLGLLSCIGGAVLITLLVPDAHTTSIVGDLYILIAALCSVVYLVLLKPITVKYNGLVVMMIMGISATIIAFPLGIRDLMQSHIFHSIVPTEIWLKLSYSLIFATIIGYYFSVIALNYITPFTESAYIYALPLIGTTVSIAMGLDHFTWHDPVAFVLILLGFILMNSKKVKKVV